MSKENSAGLGVNNHYGARSLTDGAAGVFKTEGLYNELVIELNGENINNDVISTMIRSGAKAIEAVVEVKEAFTLTGTTPTLEVGTDGSEATNGFSISEAQLEAEGTYVITSFNGTWANALAADTTVSVALGGTTPTVSGGKARIVVRYVNA